MCAYIGTVECWFSISGTCIRLHGKPTWLFFQSSIQGFLGGLFLFRNKCALNKDALVAYGGNVKSQHLEGGFIGNVTELMHFIMRLRSYLFTYFCVPMAHDTRLLEMMQPPNYS